MKIRRNQRRKILARMRHQPDVREAAAQRPLNPAGRQAGRRAAS